MRQMIAHFTWRIPHELTISHGMDEAKRMDSDMSDMVSCHAQNQRPDRQLGKEMT